MSASLITLASFTGTNGNGAYLSGNLISDAAGDLFGTTQNGGVNDNGTVYELVKTGSTYAAPVTLTAFTGNGNGANPYGGLISDAAGDLFGTTEAGSTNNDGDVFELVKTGTTYGTPVVLTVFGSGGKNPYDSLIRDSAGDLFGTTEAGGANNDGTVFERVFTGATYSAPVTLATFNGTGNGANPYSGLISDSAGNLFGTTQNGGAHDLGTVFELVKSGTTYSAPVTLMTFNGSGNGANPHGGLTFDGAGNLFGATAGGGTNNDGTVFEIPKISAGYTFGRTLASFDSSGNGRDPDGTLIIDAAGNLFGTTYLGGLNDNGTVFEVAKTGSTYSAPVALVTFNSTNGARPVAGLLSDATGNLFGTTEIGGTNNLGTVFEITGSGYVMVPVLAITSAGGATHTTAQTISGTIDAADAGLTVSIYDGSSLIGTATPSANGAWSTTVNLHSTLGTQSITAQTTDASGLVGTSNAVNYNFFPAVASDFTGNGTSDVLLQNGGTVVDWLMQNGLYSTGNVLTTGATGYTTVGTGDFTANGISDVLLQNGGTVVDWIMNNGKYQSGNILTTAATGYNVVGTGDFNGDHTSDVLLQNGGTVVDWIIKNGLYQSGNVVTTAATGFTVVGTGDLNNDGTSDVLLQNGGTVVDWIMQNGQYQSGNVVTTGATGFTVVGTGDFNGDGTSDVLLQNGGTVVDWIMKNGAYQSGNVLTTAATGFTVVGTGDYNGDGTSDVLLQNGGTVVDWVMKNGAYQSGNVITTGAAGYTVAPS